MLALPGWCSRMSGLGGGGFVDEFKVAVFGRALRQYRGGFEVVGTVLVRLRAVEENSPPLGGGHSRDGLPVAPKWVVIRSASPWVGASTSASFGSPTSRAYSRSR